jgi:outer membrane murein-binding lipoprotein Lpp
MSAALNLDLKKTPFRRVNPHPGLMIDVDVWRDAHDYHRDQLNLHHLALHGWGIVDGLEVSLVAGDQNTVRIEAGIGIDPVGRFIIVPQSQTYQVTARTQQSVYLVLQFRDVLAEPSGNVPTRVVEAYRIQERDRLPEEPYIELARIAFDPRAGSVKPPKDGEEPGRNELDLRGRVQLGSLAAEPRLAAAPRVDEAADGLAPRIDTLSQQLGAVAEQVAELTNEVEAARHATPPQIGASESTGEARLDDLAAQVQHLAGRVDSFGNQPGGDRVVAVPERTQESGLTPSISAEQVSDMLDQRVSDVVDQRVSTVLQRVDGVASQTDSLAQQIAAAQQRGDSDIQGLGERVDGLRHEVDALGLQVQALARQVDGASFASPTPSPAATAMAVAPQRDVLRLAVAEHRTAGWDAHSGGLGFLARELTATGQVTGQAIGTVRLQDAVGIQLLYLSGHAALALDDTDVYVIGRLLDEGAVVLGEGCVAGPNGEAGAREFAMSFVDVANRLGRQLTRVDRGHPLMAARHVFGELPTGARTTARVLEAGGLVYSDADYGCAWQGGPAEHPLPRTAIRDACDFGMNLALFRRGAV